MPVCSSCGQPVRSGDEFCQTCGQHVGGRDEPALGVAHMSALSAAGGGTPNTSTPTALGRLLVRHLPPEDQPDAEPGELHEFALDGRNVAIGRSPSCDIVLDGDQLVSRRHALLRYDGQHFTIVDLGSSNGTYVNGTEIRETTPLAEGDRILLGEHELQFSTEPASPSASFAGARPGPVGSPSPATAASASIPRASRDLNDLPPADQPEREEGATAEVPAVVLDAPQTPAGADDELAETQADVAPEAAVQLPDEPYVERVTSVSQPLTGRHSSAEVTALSNQLRQLAEASELIAQRAESEARLAEQRGGMLQEAYDRLSAIVSGLHDTAAEVASKEEESRGPENIDELITTARQASENPRHLDYLSSLGARAGEIADALERQRQRPARPAIPDDALAALDQLVTWLERQTQSEE